MVSSEQWVDATKQQLDLEGAGGGQVSRKVSAADHGPDIHAPVEPIPDNDWVGETWGLFWPDQELENNSEDPTKYIKVSHEQTPGPS